MNRVVLTLILFVVSAAIAAAYQVWRARPAPTNVGQGEPPSRVDRRDFSSPESPWLIAVFTAATCLSCAAVRDTVAAFERPSVVVTDVEVAAAPALHKRYKIESVPTTILADTNGTVVAAWVGPLSEDDRRLLAQLTSD